MITGAAGLLGTATVARFSATSIVLPLTHQDLDIRDEPAVLQAARLHRPDVIINCAAYNDVDGAEDDPQAALEANAFGVLSLARAAAACGVTLVHYSTDFVFDGEADRPYVEDDPACPRSHYGRSKLLGEWFAADAARYYVLRVESLFGGLRQKSSSVDRLLSALQRGEPAKAFVDRTVTPSYVVDVTAATEQLLALHVPYGLYHCVNSGVTTWLGIARELAQLLGCPDRVVPVSVNDVIMKASRPRYCALSNQKLAEYGIAMPSWRDALARYVNGIRQL
jgi:dTDP-4-dehydrorhamnose reductase